MPLITIAKPFAYRQGGETKLYETGEQDVSAAVAAHAKAHGFIANPTPKPAPKGAEKQ